MNNLNKIREAIYNFQIINSGDTPELIACSGIFFHILKSELLKHSYITPLSIIVIHGVNIIPIDHLKDDEFVVINKPKFEAIISCIRSIIGQYPEQDIIPPIISNIKINFITASLENENLNVKFYVYKIENEIKFNIIDLYE